MEERKEGDDDFNNTEFTPNQITGINPPAVEVESPTDGPIFSNMDEPRDLTNTFRGEPIADSPGGFSDPDERPLGLLTKKYREKPAAVEPPKKRMTRKEKPPCPEGSYRLQYANGDFYGRCLLRVTKKQQLKNEAALRKAAKQDAFRQLQKSKGCDYENDTSRWSEKHQTCKKHYKRVKRTESEKQQRDIERQEAELMRQTVCGPNQYWSTTRNKCINKRIKRTLSELANAKKRKIDADLAKAEADMAAENARMAAKKARDDVEAARKRLLDAEKQEHEEQTNMVRRRRTPVPKKQVKKVEEDDSDDEDFAPEETSVPRSGSSDYEGLSDFEDE
jgi:hypothetical protein